MSLVFSKSRQPQIIMTVFCQGLQSLACLLVSFLYDCSGYHQEFVSVNLRLRLVYSPFFHFCTSLDFLSRQIFGQFSPLHFLTIFCWKGQNSSANKNPSIFFWPKKRRCLSHLPKMRVFDLQLSFSLPNLFLVHVTQKSQQQLTERRLSLGLEEDKLMKIDIWFLLL